MTSRLGRILQSIKVNAGKDDYERIKETCGVTDLRAIISGLEKTCGIEVAAMVMKACGRQCIPDSFIQRAKSAYADSGSIDDFLNRLNNVRIGGGKLHIRDGIMVGVYEKCYCTLAKKTAGLSSHYCFCSAGWYEELFSSVYEKPVQVRKLRSILDGSDYCEFEIDYID